MFTIHSIKILLTLYSTLFYQLQPNQGNSVEEKLHSYEWQKRVILVIASSRNVREYIEQKRELEIKKGGIQDRDLEILYLAVNNINDTDKTFIRKKFKIQDQKFCIILIGKDGGEKRRSYNPLQVEDLFQTIDAMPMRQQEMRSNNK